MLCLRGCYRKRSVLPMVSTLSSSTELSELKPLPFACQGCGSCCTSVRILIDPEQALVLDERPWVQALFEAYGLTWQDTTDVQWRIPLKPDRTCLFLSDDKRCEIHANEGLALKPSVCKAFPFAPVDTPQGMRVDTAASCQWIATTLLSAQQPIVPASDESPPSATEESPLAVLTTIRLGTGFIGQGPRWTMAQYQQWEQEVWSAAVSADSPYRVFSLLAMATHVVLQAPDRIAPVPSFVWTPFAVPLYQALLFYYHRWPYGVFSQWQWVGQNIWRDPKVFGDVPISLLPLLHQRKTLLFSPNLDALHAGFESADDAEQATQTLVGFARHLLTRKIPLAHGSTLAQVVLTAWLAVGFVVGYALALAALNTRTRLVARDVQAAIQLVERYYTGHQPHFLHRMRQIPWAGAVLRLLAGR